MKKLKAEPKRSSSKNLDHDLISGRLDLQHLLIKNDMKLKQNEQNMKRSIFLNTKNQKQV